MPGMELLTYVPTLTSLTAGKGSYRMEFFDYEDVPKVFVSRVVAEQKKEMMTSASSERRKILVTIP